MMMKINCGLSIVALAFCLLDCAQGDLVAQWKFNEQEGILAYDSVGENHGTIYGADWVSEPYGNALYFDGINDYVEVKQSNILAGSNQFTIEAWINISNAGGQDFPQHYIVDSRDGQGGGFGLNVDTEKIQIWIGDWYPDLPSTIQVGQWHHVVGAYTGSEVVAYVDGQEMGRVNYVSDIPVSTAPLYIGQRYTFDERFHGLMGEVRIYNGVIPEPCTISLLALGGLLLMRNMTTYKYFCK